MVNAGRLNEKTTRTNIWKDANRLERGKKNCLEILVAWNFKEFSFFFFGFIVFGEKGDQDVGISVGNKEEGYEIFMEESWRYEG